LSSRPPCSDNDNNNNNFDNNNEKDNRKDNGNGLMDNVFGGYHRRSRSSGMRCETRGCSYRHQKKRRKIIYEEEEVGEKSRLGLVIGAAVGHRLRPFAAATSQLCALILIVARILISYLLC